jgi:hypothetical protein
MTLTLTTPVSQSAITPTATTPRDKILVEV